MKRPIINELDRRMIQHDTFTGDVLRLHLAILAFRRALDDTNIARWIKKVL